MLRIYPYYQRLIASLAALHDAREAVANAQIVFVSQFRAVSRHDPGQPLAMLLHPGSCPRGVRFWCCP